jgi:hypothetical protein
MGLPIFEIKHALGLDKDFLIILSSLTFMVIIWFYLFEIGSALQIRTYVLEHRISYEVIFAKQLFSKNVDAFILVLATTFWLAISLKAIILKVLAVIFSSLYLSFLLLSHAPILLLSSLVTLPLVTILIVADKYGRKKLLYYDNRLALNYFAITVSVVAAVGILNLFEYILTGSTLHTADDYPYAIYHQLLSFLAPTLVAIIAFCVPLKVILSKFIRIFNLRSNTGVTPASISIKRIILYLGLCSVLGVTVAITPHLSSVNPNEEHIGVDTPRYVQWLDLMNNETSNPVQLAFSKISSGDRALTMILLYAVTKFANLDTTHLVEYTPVIFTPILIIVTFFLTRELTSNDKISVLAAFLSAISFQTLIGIYSGFYANWLALLLGYVFFIFLLRCLKRFSRLNLAIATILLNGVLLAHVYTWSIILCVAFFFLVILYVLGYCPRRHFLILCIILSSSMAVDLLNSLLFGSSSGIEGDVSVGLGHGFGITVFSERFGTLSDTVMTYYGGIYANIAVLGLVIYWIIRCQEREIVSIFLLTFMSISLIPLFLGDWVLQSRVLYDIPFQIPAAISLYVIWKGNHKFIFFGTILVVTYLSFHVLVNMGFVPPSNPLTVLQR